MATSTREEKSAARAVERLLRPAARIPAEPLLLVHRLDVGTSGVVLLAKSDEAHRALSRAFQSRDGEEDLPGARLGTSRARARRLRGLAGPRSEGRAEDEGREAALRENRRHALRDSRAPALDRRPAALPGDRPHAPDPRASHGARAPDRRRRSLWRCDALARRARPRAATRARRRHAAPPPCRAHRHRGARPRRFRAPARGLRGRAGRSHDAKNAAMSSSPSDEGMPRSAKVAVTALLFVGAGLRLWQYFANASLWIDEIALAENVLRRPLSALLREPLALDQVAPPGFLALAKASTAVFGESEMALRLVPLASGLLALALFPRLSRRFQPAWISVFATALFALSPTLVRYSAEFKPYSTDVAAAVALTLIAFGLGESDADRHRPADSSAPRSSEAPQSGSRRRPCSWWPDSGRVWSCWRSRVARGACLRASSPSLPSGRRARPRRSPPASIEFHPQCASTSIASGNRRSRR